MRARTPFEEKLLTIIEPVADEAGFALVRVRIQGGEGKRRLQLMAERPDGAMGVDDCALLSRRVSAVLDVEDPFSGAWELEVSSPGVDRPLTRPQDFDTWAGFTAKLELDRLVEGRKRFKGVLAGRDDKGDVLADLEGEDDTAVFPLAWIADARLVITDDLIAESLRRGTARLATPEEEAGSDSDPHQDAAASTAAAEED